MAVNQPYDWSDYQSDFVPSEAYVAQEAALRSILASLDPSPQSVLEVGPGFGRVTKILTQLWPSAQFFLSDLSEAAMEQTSLTCPEVDFTLEEPLLLQDARPFPARTFDLVVAVEVLLHISPDDHKIQRAVNNLVACVRPARQPTRAHGTAPTNVAAAKGQGSGVLITCDWTQALPSSTPIRRDNYCHDYATLFAHSLPKSTIATAVPTGLQTIFVVTRV